MANARSTIEGASLGILLGLLVGLSASPVVGSVITAIAAAALTVRATGDNATTGRAGVTAGFVPAFAIAATIVALVGIHLRSRDILSPSIKERVKRWTDADYSADTAKMAALYEVDGILPQAWSRPAGTVNPGGTVLFGSERTSVPNLERLRPDRYESADVVEEAWTAEGGVFADFAAGIKSSGLTNDQQRAVLSATWTSLRARMIKESSGQWR